MVRQLADSKGRVQRGSPSNRAHEARAERAVEIAESTLRRVKSECRAFEERCIMLETEVTHFIVYCCHINFELPILHLQRIFFIDFR